MTYDTTKKLYCIEVYVNILKRTPAASTTPLLILRAFKLNTPSVCAMSYSIKCRVLESFEYHLTPCIMYYARLRIKFSFH